MMNRFSCFSSVRVFLRTTLLAGGALVLIACGGDGDQAAETDETREMTSASPDTIEVTMQDHAYQPSSITVPAGQEVTLQLTNAGTVEHYFVVGDTIAGDKDGFRQNLFGGVSIEKHKQTEEHEEEEEHHENEFELPPGGTGSMTFTLPESKAGTYTIACFETTGGQKHYEMGMQGTLTVSASSDN